MSSRRNRIKVIANLNVRRKNVADENQVKSEKISDRENTESIEFNHHEQTPINQEKTANEEDSISSGTAKSEPKECADIPVEEVESEITEKKTSTETENTESNHHSDTLVEVAETKIKENSTHEYSDKNQSPLPETICRNSILNNDKQATDTLLTGKARIPLRRKLIKIPVSVNVLNRKSKESKVGNNSQNNEDHNNEFKPEKVNETHDTESPSRVNDQQDTIFAENEVTLDETILVPRNCIPDPEDTNGSASDKLSAKPIQLTGNVISDIDYPPPPPSPNKMNRSRIKAIPRFGYRKASFSASESEDESRKHNRIRNDSVCSTTSAIAESITECLSPQKQREITSIVPKKCNRSEQTRKLAEARREFQRRFGSEKPDRQKLTMMDLLFYNPKSNPMIDGEKEKQENAKKEDKVDDNINESEIVDDPQPEEDTADKSDEENAVPVPQIKIGPSGEIILDEKSLVIESKEVKRQREEMQKTDVVNGDFDTGYGVYKKHKRSKTWSHEETVRFYKALNTIGTDFTLMTELFSNRSRRDLKMKFKKEERINGNLLNKAVMCPGSFEFDELRNEAVREEKEMEELKKQKENMKKRKAEEARVRNEMLEEKAKKIKGESAENTKTIRQPKAKPGLPQPYLPEPALPKPSLPEPTQPGPPLTEPSLPKPEVSKPRKRSKKAKLDMEVYVDESDADESDLATQSESDDEIVIPQGPTRSGRMPKVTKKYENELCTVENIMLRTKVPDNIKPSNVEPGSIMIISEMGANGEPVYKIFMVTPDQMATPLNVPSDKVNEAIQLTKGMSAKNIITISENHTDDEVEAPIENNQTIPADETVTTLKSDKLMQENFPLTSEDESVCVNRNVGLQYVESDASVTDYDVASSTLDGESGENYVVMSSEN